MKELQPRKVLIVEDSDNWLRLLPALFSNEGIEALAVDSLEAAREALKTGQFTEVVTDSLEGDWLDVVESAATLPVKLLTGNGSLERAATDRGVVFLDKATFDIETLISES